MAKEFFLVANTLFRKFLYFNNIISFLKTVNGQSKEDGGVCTDRCGLSLKSCIWPLEDALALVKGQLKIS